MKPNFALSLYFDRVELLHRTDTGWDSLGDVPFDAPDLPAALSALRKKALTHDPSGLRTKLILPDEQVKFLSLPEADAGDEAVRTALDGATPYSLDELVYEYSTDGMRTHIAAVARETLDEAEAFAVEHRFAPVSIVAQSVVGRFEGEPFFGLTKAAAGLIGPDETVEPDSPATKPKPSETKKDAGKDEQPAPETVDTKAESKPAETAPKDADGQSDTAAPADKPAKENKRTTDKRGKDEATDPEPKTDTPKPKASKAKEPAETAPEAASDEQDAPEEPVFSARARNNTSNDPIARAVTAIRAEPTSRITPMAAPEDPPVTVQPRTVPQPVPPRPAPGTPPPAVAERLARIARSNISAERPDTLPPASPASRVPDRPTTPSAKAPPVAPAAAPGPSVKTNAAAKPAPAAPRPKDIAASLQPAPPPPATASSGLFASRRKKGGPTDHATAKEALAPQAATATAQDRSTMTVFDQRAAEAGGVGGKPRFLLPILIAILLLFMAVAAAWATIFSEDGIAGWFGGGTADQDPILTAAPSDSTPLTVPLAPAIETGPIVVTPEGSQTTGTPPAPPEQLASVTPPADAALDPEVIADPAAPPPRIVEADPPVVTPDTPPGTVLSPAEADRFYAATGVWLRAPRIVLMPTGQALGDLSTAATDRALTTRSATATLPALGQLFPDTALATQIDPPAADVVFPRDDRGLLLATADGTRSPYGMLIYAGQPAVVPPTRPGTVAPEPVVIAEPEVTDTTETTPPDEGNDETVALAAIDTGPTDTDAETNATDTQAEVTAALEALIAESAAPATEDTAAAEPQTDTVAPTAQRDDRGLILASADGTAAEGLLVFAGLPAIVPPTRPGTTLPQETTAPDETAAPEETPGITPGGVSFAGLRPNLRPQTLDIPASAIPLPPYDGLRPSLRPDGLAPDTATDQDVTETLPQTDDDTVAATLAAIVAAAPDPLAGATQQAIARAIIPEARPRNFDRVVAAAQARLASTVPTASTTTATRATEPEAVSSGAAQPSGPVPQSVATAATIESAINLRQINLIGVYGRPNDRRALVRLANGRYVRVSVGDRLDGGQVTAIGDNVINYVKRGQTIALGVPG